MKWIFHIILLGFLSTQLGCEKETIDPDTAKLTVDFTWEGLNQCEWGNPEIYISGVPEQTSTLKISMFDHAYNHDHGTVLMPYAGETVISKERFKKIQGPCPVYTPGSCKMGRDFLENPA